MLGELPTLARARVVPSRWTSLHRHDLTLPGAALFGLADSVALPLQLSRMQPSALDP